MTRREARLWEIAEQELTPKQLRVLRDYLNGHSIRRIAISTARSEATVRGHLARALQIMKPHLRKDVA